MTYKGRIADIIECAYDSNHTQIVWLHPFALTDRWNGWGQGGGTCHKVGTIELVQQGHKSEGINRTQTKRFYTFVFNGKEKDYESGFHYYGARYYWSEVLTGWLSVDPLSDKYPSISPYAYCVWNPIKLIDPDGRDTAFAGAAERALYLNYREKVFSDDKYKQVQNELIHLEQASEVFCIRVGENISNSKGGGNFTYNTTTGQFDINIKENGKWSDIERLSHELKHADQFLNRKLTLLIDTKGHARFYNYSVDDELEAYNRQGMFGNTLTSEEVYQAYGKRKGLSWYGINRQYVPSSNDIWTNANYQEKYGHPRILYQGWENDVKQSKTR